MTSYPQFIFSPSFLWVSSRCSWILRFPPSRRPVLAGPVSTMWRRCNADGFIAAQYLLRTRHGSGQGSASASPAYWIGSRPHLPRPLTGIAGDATATGTSWRFHSSTAAPDGVVEAVARQEASSFDPSYSPSLAVRNAREATFALRHYGRCYWELSKARLSMLVVATSGTGFILGSGNVIDFAGLCWTCGGTMMVAASANSLNQVFEKENDALMKRTRQRPLPSGRISASHAAIWASSIGVGGTSLLAWKTNLLAAGLAASNLALYAFLYTPLKQIHPINTWVGAVVGAIPPLLGWAAACGDVSLNGMILPAALYFWQIPHFMALAYLCRNDYAAGGFQMFSLADPSGLKTALVSLRNCLYLLPVGYFAYEWGIASEWVFWESSFLTMCISAAAVSFVHERTKKTARRMFHASLLYLPVFMSGLLLHRLPNEEKGTVMADSDRLVVFEDHTLNEEINSQSNRSENSANTRVQPPIAYASVAPFPFLPAPLYVPPDP